MIRFKIVCLRPCSGISYFIFLDNRIIRLKCNMAGFHYPILDPIIISWKCVWYWICHFIVLSFFIHLYRLTMEMSGNFNRIHLNEKHLKWNMAITHCQSFLYRIFSIPKSFIDNRINWKNKNTRFVHRYCFSHQIFNVMPRHSASSIQHTVVALSVKAKHRRK